MIYRAARGLYGALRAVERRINMKAQASSIGSHGGPVVVEALFFECPVSTGLLRPPLDHGQTGFGPAGAVINVFNSMPVSGLAIAGRVPPVDWRVLGQQY